MHALQNHMAAVRAHPYLLPPQAPSPFQKGEEGIDMKLELNEAGARSEDCRRETGFDRLRVSRCQEVGREGGKEGGREGGRECRDVVTLPHCLLRDKPRSPTRE